MTDLLRDDTDFEMSKYYEARNILEAGVNPAIEKNKKSVFNTETGMNDVLLPMSNGGYIKIADEAPKVMSEAPKQPTGMSRTEEILEYAKTPGISEKEDFEAAGFTPEEIETAFPTRQDVKPITAPEPRTEEISQEEMADRISKGEAFFVPNDTLREQGTSLVNEFFFDRAVDALRDELQEQGMSPDQIEREIQARSPEFMRNAEVYSNALFGTGATGFEVGAADFLTAGAMDIQEGYNLFSANMPGKGDSMLGRVMGMGMIAAGIAEATGVGYGFGKLLKKGIDKLRPTLARMGADAEARIENKKVLE
jgi:hypothetical protein